VHDAFFGALPSLESCQMTAAEFAESVCRLTLRTARLATHAKERAKRLEMAAAAVAGTDAEMEARAVVLLDEDKYVATGGDEPPRFKAARSAFAIPTAVDGESAWADEAAVMSTLASVVAKLLVCTEAPEDGMASGGLFASQAVGSLNA